MFLSPKIPFVFLLIFQLLTAHAQNSDKIKTEFLKRKGIKKVAYYEKLNLNQKRAYRDFFYQNFPKLASDDGINANKKTQIRYKFFLAEVYNIKEAELQSD